MAGKAFKIRRVILFDIKSDVMALWILKGGEMGEREPRMLEHNVIALGWERLPDLSNIKTKDDLRKLYEKTYPDASKGREANHVGQLFAFIHDARVGDLVVVPLKTTHNIAIGKIDSEYKFGEKYGKDMMHYREIKWIKKDFSRSSFDQDLLYTFGAFLTFCRAERNNAELRINNIITGKKEISEKTPEILEVPIDVKQVAEDQIREFISRKFRGHGFAYLVDGVLRAKGFTTKVSPPGPDGGVDILAAPGMMGLNKPRICVQVKSADAPAEVGVYKELKATMGDFGATHGLLVSFGGFKESIRKEHKKEEFKIKLWDLNDFILELLKNYSKLEPEVKNKIPLNEIFILNTEELE